MFVQIFIKLSAVDFGQVQTLIGNISGMDQAINKWKMVLSTTIFFYVR